jgi:hypothetical protein
MKTPEGSTEKLAVETTKTKILEYLKNPTQGRTSGHFVVVCGFTTRFVDGDHGLPVERVVDRALQSLRKGGLIKFDKGQWYLAAHLSLTVKDVTQKVAEIMACAGDFDAAHGLEDKLFEAVLEAVAAGAPNAAELAAAALTSKKLDFARHTA